MVKRLLNGNILVRIKKTTDEYVTASGIYLSGVEHDFLQAEVIQVPEESFYYDEDEKKYPMEVKPGDLVVLEKNFHHKYNVAERHRIDHTQFITQDPEYNYFITKAQDILLVSTDDQDNSVDVKGLVAGKLFSIMHQLAGTAIKRS